MEAGFKTRLASINDLGAILNIYNQGIEDKIATLEENQKDIEYMTE
jgi:L-amino acid N-acyltransferase YncA